MRGRAPAPGAKVKSAVAISTAMTLLRLMLSANPQLRCKSPDSEKQLLKQQLCGQSVATRWGRKRRKRASDLAPRSTVLAPRARVPAKWYRSKPARLETLSCFKRFKISLRLANVSEPCRRNPHKSSAGTASV